MKPKLFALACTPLFCCHSTLLEAASFTFTKVADTNTAIPGGTGNFTSFDHPSLDGGNVAIVGRGSSSQRGFYTDIGGLPVEPINDSSPQTR